MTAERYDYSAMTPDTVRHEMRHGIEAANALVAKAVAADPPSFDGTLGGLSDASWTVVAGAGRSLFPGRLHPQREVRDAASQADQELQNWEHGLVERDDVARAVNAFSQTDEAQGLTGFRRRVLEVWQRELRRAGHELEEERRRELSNLRRRMVELAVEFERNVTEWRDELVLEPADMGGLPAAFVEQLPAGPSEGSKRLPIVADIVVPFLEQSQRRDLRREALRRLLSRAVEVNRPLLEELLALRRQVATSLGYESWSDYANAARMSGSAAGVREFLDRTIPPLQELAASEGARMRQQLRDMGVDDDLQAWDWFYFDQRQRDDVGLSAARLKEHFPLDAALEGMFALAHDVFGVSARRLADVPTWHPDMLVYELSDSATGEHLCDLYLDLFNREGKPAGAWTFPLRPPRNRKDGPRQPAAMAFASNFAPAQGSGPALLEHYDVETLLHEFGHVLEFGLERTAVFQPLSSAIETDYVEAPSQIMENWAWEPAVLSRFGRHHASGAPIPSELLEGLTATRRVNSGMRTIWRYAMRAMLDQLLHGPEAMDLDEAYRKAFAVTGLPFVEGTFLPSAFVHIANMYDAGFYSYLWAQVFGYDMFSEFAEKGVLSGEVGRRYRSEVLEPSWGRTGRERTRGFLGREPSERAFLEALGLTGSG